MPIKSYIAYPAKDKKPELVKSLKSIPECAEVLPSENEDIVLLVTDTPTEFEEKELEAKLNELPYLQCLAMVFGHEATNI